MGAVIVMCKCTRTGWKKETSPLLSCPSGDKAQAWDVFSIRAWSMEQLYNMLIRKRMWELKWKT